MRIARNLFVCVFVAAGLWIAVASGQGRAKAPDKTASVKAPGGVKIVPASIEEKRRKDLIPKKTRWGSIPPELKLTLHVVGDAAAKAKRFGRVKITKAVDDTGENLIKTSSTFSRSEGMATVDKWKKQGVTNGFSVELKLKPSARKAAKISTLKGSFVLLTGGKIVDVTIADVVAHAGKEVKDAALAEAGVKLKISSQTKGGKVAYTVEGNTDVVVGAELVDAAGKVVRSFGGWQQSGKGPKVYSRRPQGKMPEKVGLKLTILKGAKSVTVPINLKDIPLP